MGVNCERLWSLLTWVVLDQGRLNELVVVVLYLLPYNNNLSCNKLNQA